MARAVGGMAGVTPLGDRPGTTTAITASGWKGTPAGRARILALTAFGLLVFMHLAAEHRFAS